MVPVLKKLKVWTLYMHIVAQVNHRGLRVQGEGRNKLSER